MEEMPTGDNSDYCGLSDSDDVYLPDAGTQAMAGVPVLDNSTKSSEYEAGANTVDRKHWRKRLLDCSLPAFTELPTMSSIAETPLSYFRKFLTS